MQLLRSFRPSRDLFVEPDSGLPLKCDMCESVPPLPEPMCVQVCGTNALTYVEREVDRQEKPQPKREQIEIGLESLVNQYGVEAVIDSLKRMSEA